MNEVENAVRAVAGPKPTLGERFWRWLGYRPRFPELTDEAEKMPGWCMTHVDVRVSLGDRLRLLVSGHALVRVETRTSEPVDAVSCSSFEVVPPASREGSE